MVSLSRRRLLAAVVTGTVGAGIAAAVTGGPDRPAALDVDCPDYGEDVAAVACNDHRRLGVTLEPSTTSVAAPGTITFTLRNRSHREFRTNWFGWRLHKRVDDDWVFVGPRRVPLPLHVVRPGGTLTWTVTLRSDPSGRDIDSSSETIEWPGLGPGTYAFGIDGWSSDADRDSKTALSETFALDGASPPLEPADAVETVEWEDDVLVARTDRLESADRPTAYELDRVDDPDDEAERMILEQVLQDGRFRTTLALALEHGADRVRLEDDDRGHSPLSWFPGVYEYEGKGYRLETAEL
ncbi:hypothetical protein [Natronobeatus ordinarius]|uniref:hypothetical protein n=1 Tax=Natronobeatus ordinarius TaxID=2963433 RepID=UPI0020CF736C|nr:hypothetical protein [Natronobeatus ordinarius]